MVITNNLIAMNAERNMKIGNKRLKASTEKLATGYSVNRAADNSAGLQISEKMRSQIRGLDQASNNIGDGISFVQVADGALGDIQSILNRVRELSVKSANDTNAEIDRQAIDDEVQELKTEMSEILNRTEFNNKKIWDEKGNDRVQIGTEQVTAVTANSNFTTGTLNNINKASIPSDDYYQLNADNNGITVSWNAYNGTSYTSKLINWPTKLSGNHSFQLTDYLDTTVNPELTGLNFKYSYNVDEASSLTDIISSLNGVKISCNPSTSESVETYTKDGTALSGITFMAGIDYPPLLASNKDFDAYDNLFIESSVGGVATQNNMTVDPTTMGSSNKWSFEFNMPNIGMVTATSNNTYYYSNWKDPDQKWWDTSPYGDFPTNFDPTPNDGSLDSVNASLVNSDLDLVNDTITGGTIVVRYSLKSASPFTLANGDSSNHVGNMFMYINVGPDDTLTSINDTLKNIKGFDIYAGNKLTNAPSTTEYYANSGYAKNVIIDKPIYQSITNLKIQSGANSNESIEIKYRSWNNLSLGVDSISTLTRDDSDAAISSVDNAMKIISGERALFGSYQNRLEYAKANVNIENENTADAESRIRDTDMASEMVHYSKENILQQVNQSFLAQANTINQNVLEILK